MTHSPRTFALTPKWDIRLDNAGRIALKTESAATAQNVANECRLFLADACFNQDEGVPHFILQLGKAKAQSALVDHLRVAAQAIPDVAEIIGVELSEFDPQTRTLSGTIHFTTIGGQHVTTEF